MKKSRKIISFLMTMVLTVGLILISQTADVNATDVNDKMYNIAVFFDKKMVVSTISCLYYIFPDKYKVGEQVKYSSSNKKVVDFHGNGMDIGRPGKATVKLTTTVNGKKKVYRGKIRVVKYRNPFKSLKIGGKSLEKTLDDTIISSVKVKHGKVRVKIRPEKNWKVKRIDVQKAISSKSDFKVTEKRIKNGDSFNFKKSTGSRSVDYQVIINMYNKKTGLTETFQIFLD